VVCEVVGAEGGGVGDANGKVGEDGEEPVEERGLESKIVRNLVDGEEEVLVCGRANDVGGEEKGP